MTQTWTLIIFCYNEDGNIGKVIDKSLDLLKIISPAESEIVIVDDGSKDSSKIIIQNYKKKHTQLKTVFHPKNLGIGEALISGYINASMDNICAIPGDGQFDLNELIPYKSFPEKSVLSFYRKENTTYSIFRNVLSKFNKLWNQHLNSIYLQDVNWVKAYKKVELNKLNFDIRSSLVESEICAKLYILSNNFIQVESKYLVREHGVSKGSNLFIVTQAIRDMIKLVIVITKFKKGLSKLK
jgi:dolichol-phosphate mannosyltransferase